MRKIVVAVLALVAVAAVPAQAKPGKPHPAHPAHPAASKKCKVHNVGYKAHGTLVSESLTQTQGAGTETRRDDRYSGDVTVDVTKANHHAPTGTQTYTLDNDRVKFYDANHDHVADTPKAGDRVKIKGKISKLAKKCDQTGFTPEINVRRVEFKPAKS
jgi:hypothetical protein